MAERKQLNKRLLFVVTEDWTFVSHRFHLAIAAIEKGYHVGLLSKFTRHRDIIKNAGVQVFDWSLNRGSINPLLEMRSVLEVVSAIKNFQPNLLHAVAIKPVVYSAIACRYTGVDSRVFALGGLGFIFSSRKRFVQLLRSLLVFVFRILLSGQQSCLILQNPDDRSVLLSAGVMDADQIRLIRGAGVDTSYFLPQSVPEGTPLVVLPARMLWDKGVLEFVEVARTLNGKGVNARFALVGPPDPHNPESVPKKQLDQWVKEGDIEWWGHRYDMRNVYRQATIVCLPSYREGLPKSLLEAASCSRPIVTYDVPGCREIVSNGVNGILVPFKDQKTLLMAIEKLLGDSELCSHMGKAGRELAEKEFSQEKVAAETIKVWEEVMN
jgi:glycosyltransferase involved in cell wall biosynthesis